MSGSPVVHIHILYIMVERLFIKKKHTLQYTSKHSPCSITQGPLFAAKCSVTAIILPQFRPFSSKISDMVEIRLICRPALFWANVLREVTKGYISSLWASTTRCPAVHSTCARRLGAGSGFRDKGLTVTSPPGHGDRGVAADKGVEPTG